MPEFFGLDIGSYALKAVELEKKGEFFRLLSFGSTPTPTGAPFSESELDQKELATAFKELLKEAKIKSRQVVTAFPESLIFTRVIEMPEISEKELANAIKYEAEQYVPMPVSDVKLSWMILEKEQGIRNKGEKRKMKVLLVAAPLSLVDRYVATLRMAGLEPVALETETVAIVRCLARGWNHVAPTTLFVSIGASTTDLCIVDASVIQFTRSIGTGGTALARAIAQELGFEMGQAEEYKKSYGLLEDQLEGKIMQTIKPVFDVVVNEIERAILYFHTRHPTTPIKRIVLTGGTAQLPGVIVYLAESLGLEVQIGNPWEHVEVPEALKEATSKIENQVCYAVATGLAMKTI